MPALRTALSLTTSLLIFLAQLTHANELASLTLVPQNSTHYVYLDAHLEAVNQSTISAQTSGIVEAIKVDVNDKVTAGQTLILINNSQQQAALSQAQANLAQAQALNEDAQILLQRNRSLLAKKTLSQGEFDRTVAQAKSRSAAVDAAKAALKQAQEQLTYTRITAPYAGIVKQRMVEVGELVSPGQGLMTGFALTPLRATTHIPQYLVNQLKAGSEIKSEIATAIKIRANGKLYDNSQFTLFPYADERFASVKARIQLAETAQSELFPGAWVEVAIPVAQQKKILIPETAVLRQGELASVYVKKEAGYKLRLVRLGQALSYQPPSQVEVLSGLSAGETIAIHGKAAAMSLAEE